MKNVLVFFGGVSPEHEVSVITGLQIFENIDRSLYNPIPIFVSDKGIFYRLKPINNRKNYSLESKSIAVFSIDAKDNSPQISSGLFSKEKIFCAINTLHGGGGESGGMAGFFESYNIPYTSTNVESSVICMNKSLAKKLVSELSIPVVKSLTFTSTEIKKSAKEIAGKIIQELELPVIIKPVHLGSSIGIKISKDPIKLELDLLETAQLDNEILVEKFLPNISEFNCSVRTHDSIVETSEIERPLTKTEILSFSEKYEKGGKKTTGGMASLSRELPAKISPELNSKIKDYSVKIYNVCKCKGVVRIDYIQSENGEIFFNEINPIPGSMAFYLWEAAGIPFKQQISELIVESVKEHSVSKSINFVHKTDIINKFIKNFRNQ